MTSPLASESQPYLPSNQQLVQGMPSDMEIPYIAGASEAVADETTSIDESILPDTAALDQLLGHFAYCTNSAYPIFHLPSLRQQMQRVSGGKATSADISAVLCE
jgi:hypothetical protein